MASAQVLEITSEKYAINLNLLSVGNIKAISVSPDSSRIIAASHPRGVNVLDLESKKVIYQTNEFTQSK